MWEILAYALIAAGSVLSTYFTNKQSKEESDKQRLWQENMMDKQNEYNRLTNQFERAEEAGVNPLAMTMGNGLSVSGNTSVSPGNYQLPNILDPMSMLGSGASNLASAFSSAQQGLSDKTFRGARLDQIEQQSNKIREEIVNLHASTDAQLIANKYADELNLWAIAGKKADVSLTYAQVASTNQIARKTAQEIKNLVTENFKTGTDIQLNYLNMHDVLAHISSQYKDIELKDSEIVKNQAQTDVLNAQEHNINASTDLLSAESDLKNQEAQRYGEVTDKVIAQYDAAISQIQAETGKTRQEAYWIWFDKVDSQSISILGNRLSQTRFGPRKLRKKADQMIADYPEYFEY